MFKLEPDEANVLRSFPQQVPRYLSVCPRDEVYACQIDGLIQDSETNGVYAISVKNGVGNIGSVMVGMTIDVGTEAGLSDVGFLRVRKAPSGNTLYIGEIATGEIGLKADLHLTVRNEFRIWNRRPRLVGQQVGVTYTNNFISYRDYDEAYIDQNYNLEPKANVFGDYTPDGSITPVKMSGFVDKGQTYRTVKLNGSKSFCLAGTITTYAWDVGAGASYVSGNSASSAVTVRFPVGFRYIHLTVTASTGKSSRISIPIWVHDSNYKPEENFTIGKDERGDGREMSFSFFGAYTEESLIVRGTPVCYWEAASFPGGETPKQYIDQFYGWISVKTMEMKYRRDYYNIDVMGSHYWLSRIEGYGINCASASPAGYWWEMENLSPLKVIALCILRDYTTANQVINYFPDLTIIHPIQREEISKGNVWDQIMEYHKAFCGLFGSDSSSALWTNMHISYVFMNSRDTTQFVDHITPNDVHHADGLTVTENEANSIDYVNAPGSYYDGSDSTFIRSCAPGKTNYGMDNEEVMPFQRLYNVAPQDTLNLLSYYHYVRVNELARWGDVELSLIGNLDVVEPAWGVPIHLTWNNPGITPFSVVDKPYLVKKVSVKHENNPKTAPKTISWTIEPVTWGLDGFTGEAIPYKVEESPINTPSYSAFDVGEIVFPRANFSPPAAAFDSGKSSQEDEEKNGQTDGNLVFAAVDNGNLKYTMNLRDETPTWTEVRPATTPNEYIVDVKWGLYSELGTYGAFFLTNDYVNNQSRVWYTPDISLGAAGWEAGAWCSGIYHQLVREPGSENVYIFNRGKTTLFQHTFDFTEDHHNWTPLVMQAGLTSCQYIDGVGWRGTYQPSYLQDKSWCAIEKRGPHFKIKRIRMRIKVQEAQADPQTVTNARIYIITENGTGVESYVLVWNENFNGNGTFNIDVNKDDGNFNLYGYTLTKGIRIELNSSPTQSLISPIIEEVVICGWGFDPYIVYNTTAPIENCNLTYTVPGSVGRNTGIWLEPGDKVQISATGTWSHDGGTTTHGPAGDMAFNTSPSNVAGSRKGALLAHINVPGVRIYSKYCGAATELIAPISGYLQLTMDAIPPPTPSGSLDISITYIREKAGSRYSTTKGLTFEALQVAGEPSGQYYGNMAMIGKTALVSTRWQVKKCSEGSAYVSYGPPYTSTNRQPLGIYIPNKRINSTSDNSGTSPEYFASSFFLDLNKFAYASGNRGAFKATNGNTAITNYEMPYSTYYSMGWLNCNGWIMTSRKTGKKIVASVVGTSTDGVSYVHSVYKSIDGGQTWTSIPAGEKNGAVSWKLLQNRSGDKAVGNDVYFTDFRDIIHYSTDFCQTFHGRVIPGQLNWDGTLLARVIAFEVYG